MNTEKHFNSILLVINMLLLLAVVGLFIYVNTVRQEVTALTQAFRIPQTSLEDVQAQSNGQTAFDFTLTSTDGRIISLSDYAGKPVLLAFTWTECIYCQAMYPHLITFSSMRPDIQVLIISRGYEEDNQHIADENNFPFPMLNQDQTVSTNYLVPATPFFYFIDAAGIVRTVGYASTVDQLEQLVSNLETS